MAKSGRIPGAKQLGGVWLLPDDFSIIKVRRGRPARNLIKDESND